MRSKLSLPDYVLNSTTLASRISALRHFCNLTLLDLSKITKIPVNILQDIESGLETWLSNVNRQKIANAFKIEPAIIFEVETKFVDLQPQVVDNSCPNCNSKLATKIYDGFDINNQKVKYSKFYCTKCPFVTDLN